MYVYAQIDENNICVGISELSGKIIEKSMIPLDKFDVSIIGKKYNNGEWEEVPQPEPEPSQLDRIEEQLKLSYTEAQEQAVDAYTKELLEGGII